jgi:hypothetical protein
MIAEHSRALWQPVGRGIGRGLIRVVGYGS